MPFDELKRGDLSKKKYREMAMKSFRSESHTNDDPPVFFWFTRSLEEGMESHLPFGTSNQNTRTMLHSGVFKTNYDPIGSEVQVSDQERYKCGGRNQLAEKLVFK